MGDHEQEIYDRYRTVVDDMVESRQDHVATRPDCAVAPLCMGPRAMTALIASFAVDPEFSHYVLLTAIGELTSARERLAAAERRLEVQRAMTGDAVKALDEMRRRAEVAEEAEQSLAAALDDERAAHDRTRTEKEQWESAAEHLAPTRPVDGP